MQQNDRDDRDGRNDQNDQNDQNVSNPKIEEKKNFKYLCSASLPIIHGSSARRAPAELLPVISSFDFAQHTLSNRFGSLPIRWCAAFVLFVIPIMRKALNAVQSSHSKAKSLEDLVCRESKRFKWKLWLENRE